DRWVSSATTRLEPLPSDEGSHDGSVEIVKTSAAITLRATSVSAGIASSRSTRLFWNTESNSDPSRHVAVGSPTSDSLWGSIRFNRVEVQAVRTSVHASKQMHRFGGCKSDVSAKMHALGLRIGEPLLRADVTDPENKQIPGLRAKEQLAHLELHITTEF